MSRSGIDLPTESVTLTLEGSQKDVPGFLKLESENAREGQFAKALASGFIKFTTEGNHLSQTESVQNFIALADLHRQLTLEAHGFLHEEVPFIYEDQQIQPLLLNFAAFRLKQISRHYYFATLQNQPQSILNDLKQVIKQRQEEYDTLLQYI